MKIKINYQRCFQTLKIVLYLTASLLIISNFYGCSILLKGKTSDGEKTRLADELHAKGLMLYDEGKYEEAIDAWLKEIKLIPARVKPYNNIGLTYRKLGNFKSAIEYHEKAIKVDSKFGHTYYSLGLVYYDLKNFEKANELILKAIKLDYVNADVHYTFGQTYKQLKDYEGAIRAYEKAIELYYNYPGVHYQLGDSYRLLKKFDLAKMELKREVSINPRWRRLCEIALLEIDVEIDSNSANTFFELGMLYKEILNDKEASQEEYFEKAFKSLEKVIELDQLYPEAHFYLGQLYERKGDFPMAKQEYIKELQNNPDHREALGALEKNIKKFNYSAYTASSLKEIGDLIKEIAERHDNGLDFYMKRFKVQIYLESYPVQVNEYTQKALEYYWKSIGFKPEFLQLFTHQLDLEDSGYSFTLVFQKNLISSLQSDSKQSGPVHLYVILAIYDYYKEKIILLINEFDTERDLEEGD